MRKIISILTSISLLFVISPATFALNSSSYTTIYEATSDDGTHTVIYCEEVDDYTTIFYSYVDDVLNDIVTRTFDDTRSSFTSVTESLDENGEYVVSDSETFVLEKSEIEPYAHGTNEYTMGTMHYVGANISRHVLLTCADDYITGQTYEKPTLLTKTAKFISDFGGTFNLSAGAVGAFLDSPAFALFGEIVGDVIEWFTSEKLEATAYLHTIFGNDISDPTIEGMLTGESFFITEEGLHHEELITYGYTPYDWGTGYLGSAMFYELYEVEYTPTSWQQYAR